MFTKLIKVRVSVTMAFTLTGSSNVFSFFENPFETPLPPAIGIIEFTILPKVPGIEKAFIPMKIKVKRRMRRNISTTSQKFIISLVRPRDSNPRSKVCD